MHKQHVGIYLKTSIGVFGGSNGGFVSEGGGQAVVVTTPRFALSFCIKSCIVNPSGCANCSNFRFRFTVTYGKAMYDVHVMRPTVRSLILKKHK